MTIIGCSGHQEIPDSALPFIEQRLAEVLTDSGESIIGVCSLAAGADQLFARAILRSGGHLRAVVPATDYETTFDERNRRTYHDLLAQAISINQMPANRPTEEAFLLAGRQVVDECDTLIAIWDGSPSRGLGGTADVVSYARQVDRPVIVVWPPGVERP